MKFEHGDKVRLTKGSRYYSYHKNKEFFYIGVWSRGNNLFVVDEIANNHIVRRLFPNVDLEIAAPTKKNHPYTTIFQ
jgi:hypothetical protein